ncbi:acetolactate synthase large subunit [Brevibacterium sp. UCMA 11752]|uniref:acetolactate synthase large subunit n=1 Tax=Brevibacterium sp. UCMA 11752 TaxID=2745946 RepID=UPI001F1ECCA3|nr:acetolactate synthase large subunit [Brevibacterium sp. UCMA 11752]MCF2587738.1 acetolactate synthase large subunit [Brevibacterium sp. UCMA 11752]
MTTQRASDVMVKALENEGVERVFGIPGEENIDFIDSLRQSSIEFVLTRHEQAAAFMAATYGRLTGKPGVCLTTLGPGALNLATGAAYAHLGGMPVIMITGQKGIRTAEQARFQIVNTVATMKPLTKDSRQITSANMVPTMVREAFRVARSERPGPVHLELPEDIAAMPVEHADLIQPHTNGRATASDDAVDAAAQVIRNAKRPLLMLGADASRSDCSEALSRFVSRVRIPYFTTQMGKGSVSGSSDLYMGTAALTSRDYVHDAIEKADVIVTIGHDTTEKPPFTMDENGPTVVHVGYRAAVVEQVYFPQVETIGDLGPSLDRLAVELVGHVPNAGALLPMRAGILEKIEERSTDDRFIPQRIVAEVRTVMPVDGIVALDNGMYKIWFARNYRTTRANTLLLDNALATMGAGLPSAMAAKLTYPDRRVMAVVGDGGFMMNSQEMETAVRLGLDLVVLVLEDSSYGMIRWKQAVDGMPDYGLTFGNPEFVAYAESYGATGHRLENVSEMNEVLESAFAAGGVHLVVVPIDYSENERVLIDELGERATQALDNQ